MYVTSTQKEKDDFLQKSLRPIWGGRPTYPPPDDFATAVMNAISVATLYRTLPTVADWLLKRALVK